MSILKKFPLNNLIIFLTATLVMFLPRMLSVAGMHSYRVIIILCFASAFLMNIKNLRIDYNVARLPFYLFVSIAFIRFLSTNSFKSGLGFLLDTVVLFSLIILLIRTKKDFEFFVNVFTVFMLVYSLLGIFECVSGFNLWYKITPYDYSIQRYGLFRSNGSCINYMNNGALLLLSLPLLAWKIQQKDSTRKLAILTYILVLINVLATLTRTSILCICIVQFIWVVKLGLFKVINRHFLKILAVIIIGIFLLQVPAVSSAMDSFIKMFLALFDDSVATEISSSFGSNAEGEGQRILLYQWIWETISDNVWFGDGPNAVFSYRWVAPYGGILTKTSIENEYLLILFKFGLVGLISYVFMVISFFVNMFKLNRQEAALLKDNPVKLSFTFMVITTMLVYYASGFFFAFFEDNKLLYILMALACCYVKIQKSQLAQTENAIENTQNITTPMELKV